MQWFPRICCVHSFALLNFLLAASTRFMHPMNPGSAEGYWDAMYGIYGKEWIAGVYAPRDGMCIYYIQGLHGQYIHIVLESEAARLLPEVRTRALRDCPYLSDEERSLLKRGAGIGELTRARIDADDRKYAVDPQMLEDSRSEHAAFDERWKQMRGYWNNVVFEAAFLNGVLILSWLALWKRPRAWIRSLLAGSIVPLLFAPYYLGYCALAFTSAGPQGGALYPILLVGGFRGLRGDWNAFDVWLLEILPKPLADLTQSPGAMWSLTGGGVPPTTVLIAGALIGATSYFLIRWFARRARDASNA